MGVCLRHICYGSQVQQTKYYMKYVFIYFVALFALAQVIAGCNTPTKALNLLTPDRIGLGRAEGVMSLNGFSHGGYHGEYGNDNWQYGEENGDTWSEMEMNGESSSKMIWLEWDFPQWKENPFEAKEDKYMRDRIRHLNYRMSMMEAESSNNELVDKWLEDKKDVPQE